MQDFEKLGAFYLGRGYDLESQSPRDDLILYDSKDLTTHAVCVGMTGSGKTGLCLALLEEAAIDGIPAIAIDPKGDLGNLLLAFPDLDAASFRPWIDPDEAARKGLTPDACAAKTASTWKQGLAEWGQDGARIEAFRQAADIAIYTPGSSAGLPLSVLRSFDAPPGDIEPDAMQDRVAAAVSGLLALLGIDADPLQSRDHILLSNLLDSTWREGKNLSLPDVIRGIQNPPFDKVGVFDLESFYPGKDRMALAMRINNLLASPGFAAWTEGEPLHVPSLLYSGTGKPRISILSIAHLSDSERMFVVTWLLNEVLTWIRSLPGTSSLRALLYMDEIFGFFPPSENPPSKRPMLTLLKQARAYGLGVVLATQNPVDLDYKGLSNTGTWFIGRLQTERDKLRVLDGLEGASAASGSAFERGRMDRILSGLGARVFLMNNVHEDGPTVFQTRWALSYLRGPLTRTQIQTLMADRRTPAPDVAETTPSNGVSLPAEPPAESGRPIVQDGVSEFFLPLADAVGDYARVVYRPRLGVAARLHYVSAQAKVDRWMDVSLLAGLPDETPDVAWDQAAFRAGPPPPLASEPDPRGVFSPLPARATNPKSHAAWKRDATIYLYQERSVSVFRCADLKLLSNVGESEGEFRGRLGHAAKEKRDLQVESLRQKYGKRLATIQDRVRRAEARVEKEESQLSQQKMQTAISVGRTIVGAFLGRKTMSSGNIGSATTAMRGAGRTAREKDDIARAEDELRTQQQNLDELEAEFRQAIDEMGDSYDPADLVLETITVRPRKTDISISRLGIVWTPWRVGPDGVAEPLFAVDKHAEAAS